jgi:hypothetical protein
MLFGKQGLWSALAASLCAFLRFLATRLPSELTQSHVDGCELPLHLLCGNRVLVPACSPRPFVFHPSLDPSEEFITVFLYSGRRPSTWLRDVLRAKPPDGEAAGEAAARTQPPAKRFTGARCATNRWRTAASWRW